MTPILKLSQENLNLSQKRLSVLVRHIDGVRENCQRLGLILIQSGEIDFGKMLIANGLIHDNSKFYGIEWEYLHGDVKEENPEMFAAAAKQHIMTNQHHPEFFGSINDMPDIFLAEHCCDILARAQEFGQNVYDWIHDVAMSKYGYTKKTKVYQKINKYMGLLLEDSFK